MDISALKKAAVELRKQLDLHKAKEPAALALYEQREYLISAAERGEINKAVEARDIPGSRIMDESNLREYTKLSDAYSNFYVELIDGRGSDTFKMIETIIKKARK
jgi:hypothetical protein